MKATPEFKGRLMKRLKKLTPRKRYIFCSVIFLLLASLFLTWLLEYRYFCNDMWQTWNFFFVNPRVFFFNSFLIFLTLLFLWSIIGRPSVTVCISWIVILVIGYAHINKMDSRSYPLLPEDFQLADQAGTLSKFISIESVIRLIIACLLVIAITIIFCLKIEKRLFLRRPKNVKNTKGAKNSTKDPLWRSHLLGYRLVILIISSSVFMATTEFARHNSGERYEDIWFLGTCFTAWNQTRNYDDNGFMLGFLYNLQKLELKEPDEYSEDVIRELANTYGSKVDAENTYRENPGEENISLVIVLNESFYDPSVKWHNESLEDYYPHSGGDVTPVLHKIQKRYPHGLMYTTDYGGGTANIEFEMLTGLSNYWLNTVPYTAMIPKMKQVPSIATLLKNNGYETSAIHPFNGGMYKRNISLKKEGFDEFITESEMDYDEHEGVSEYINDKSAYKQTLDRLKETDDKQAILLITMQNHTPYIWESYENYDFEITDESLSYEDRFNLKVYYQSLHESDKYLGEFLDKIDSMDKKVAVLFFGDHAAGLIDNVNNHERQEVRDLSRLTPYFVYTNYDAFYATHQLPTTTPNCIMNTFLNTLNWQKNARYYLLDSLCADSPIMAQSYYDDRDYVETDILKKYRLLIYDIMGGNNYWAEQN